MAHKKRTKNYISEGTLAGFAGVIVLFISAFNPATASAIAVVFLLVFSAYKYFSPK